MKLKSTLKGLQNNGNHKWILSYILLMKDESYKVYFYKNSKKKEYKEIICNRGFDDEE